MLAEWANTQYSGEYSKDNIFFESPPPSPHQKKMGAIRAIGLMIGGTLGPAVLVLPYSFSLVGLLLGILLLFLVACLTLLMIWILLEASDKFGAETFEQLCKNTLGVPGRVCYSFFMGLFLYALLVTFLVTIRDTLIPILEFTTSGQSLWTSNYFVVLCITIILIFPISMLRHITVLGYISIFGVLIVIFITLTISYQIFNSGGINNKIVWIQPNTTVQEISFTISIITLGVTSVFNIFPIKSQLRNPSRKRMMLLCTTSILITSIIFLCVCCLAHIASHQILPNILHELPQDISMTTLRGLFILGLIVNFPILLFPFRYYIEDSFLYYSKMRRDGFSWRRHFIITWFTILTSLIFATIINDLPALVSLIGATAGITLNFIIPCCCYFKSIWATRRPTIIVNSSSSTSNLKFSALEDWSMGPSPLDRWHSFHLQKKLQVILLILLICVSLSIICGSLYSIITSSNLMYFQSNQF